MSFQLQRLSKEEYQASIATTEEDSPFLPILDDVKSLQVGEVLVLTLKTNAEVKGLQAFVKSYLPEQEPFYDYPTRRETEKVEVLKVALQRYSEPVDRSPLMGSTRSSIRYSARNFTDFISKAEALKVGEKHTFNMLEHEVQKFKVAIKKNLPNLYPYLEFGRKYETEANAVDPRLSLFNLPVQRMKVKVSRKGPGSAKAK